MKKVFLVLCVAAIGFAFASCKKDCVCSWKGDNLPEALQGEITVGQLSKSDCEGKLPAIDYPEFSYSCESR